MADVQLEHGFTKIANELLKRLALTKLSPTQYRIILTIWRSTYGFHKKDHEMSLTFLSQATSSHKQQVKNELDKLIDRKIVLITKEGSYSKSRTLAFNKNYDDWDNLQSVKTTTVSEITDTTVSEITDTTVSEITDTTVSEITDQKRKYKENIKIKDKDDDIVPQNYFTEYEKAFGYPPALLISDFEHWIDGEESQFTEPEEIIIEVIHRAKKQIPRNPAKYISKILKDLHNMELYSLEAVKEYNKKFDEKMANGGANDGKKYRRGNGRAASESPKEPIFGNKVGRY